MLKIILLSSLALAATSSREKSGEKLRGGCLRSEVHAKADQRRVICDCIVRRITGDKNITDADVAYLANTWESPKQKIKNAPKEADVLEDYDEDVMDSCMAQPKG